MVSRVATLPPERVWLRETKCLAVTEPLMRIASSLAGPRLSAPGSARANL